MWLSRSLLKIYYLQGKHLKATKDTIHKHQYLVGEKELSLVQK